MDRHSIGRRIRFVRCAARALSKGIGILRQIVSLRWGFVGRVVGATVLGASIAVVVWLILASHIYADRFAHMGCMGERLSLAEAGHASSPVSIETYRGYALRGWYAAGSIRPEIAIAVLPGASGNTESALRDAEIVAHAGYSTLIYEHRSCADPALLHSGGYLEAKDLISAVDYLRSRPEIRGIGVLGFSTGGTAALLAAAEDARIDAVIAMGGFPSLEADVLEPASRHAPLDDALRRMVFYFMGRELGFPLSRVDPASQVHRISPRPLLLIYGEKESWNGEALYAAAAQPKELWVVPGAGHGGYQDAFAAEYRNRIQDFLRGAFAPALVPAD
jgi:pimeloyl-ACP methyl ester carboxylesterase